MKVSVIIPMYNHGDMTKRCIELCKENAGIPVDIVVIDDGSNEPFESTDAKTIKLDRNSGFTKAVNVGLRALGLNYDYVCILNNDTIPQKDFIKTMVKNFENEQIGIVSAARVDNTDDFKMATHGADLTTGEVFFTTDKDYKEKELAIFVPFCCVMFSKKLVEDIGLLDERMRNHCSDNDYCLRAVLNNFGIVSDAEARVIHYQSVTIHENKIVPYEDQKIFAAKWFGPMMNEILSVIPINKQLNKWGRIGFAYEELKEEKPMIEVAKS